MKKSSTINLHNFQDDIFLGFTAEQILDNPSPQYSYFGGKAYWLYKPKKQQLKCTKCSDVNLTFLGQIYCPLNSQNCYHRILYILYCERCLRQFRCIRQQASQSFNLQKCKKIKDNLRKISENSYEIETDSYQIKNINKLVSKIKRQIEQQIIIEEEVQNEQQDENIEQFQNKKIQQKIQQYQMQSIQENISDLKIEQTQKQKKDNVFEVYKKIMTQLNGPSMLYTNQYIPYNRIPINPRHQCKYCGNKLSLQVQITEKVLLIQSQNPDSKLLLLDWGSLMIFTCLGSCNQGTQECIVAQYQQQAIKQQYINKIKKKKKNRKKKQKKQRSKSKNKQELQINQKEKQQNDWD